MQIETPSSSELPRLVEVWEAAVRATHDFLPEADLQLIKPLLISQYFPQLQLTCIRDQQGTIQGFSGSAEGKVEMLFVAPAAHGKGLGKALLNDAINRLGATEVDVNEQNPQAVAFYLSQGFEVVSRSPLDGGGRPFPILHLRLASHRH
ncbi:GNAT family N-acetyltransferase [Ectopseudomonas mendocina]|uniref:GNAT family N-acetyltransferase n=1 Tax=Ectopseudomonas mendocina TaxID=300 RepID=A0ABZ2RDC5_ECTME